MTLQVQQTFFRFCVIYVMYIFDRESYVPTSIELPILSCHVLNRIYIHFALNQEKGNINVTFCHLLGESYSKS